MFKPLEKNTIVEDIILSIKDSISSGDLKPGDKLPSERELAEQLNVSRTSIREALRALSMSGILIKKHGDGTYLNEMPLGHFSSLLNSNIGLILEKSDFLQLMEARKILEIQLAALAAKRATPDLIDGLYDSYIRMQEGFEDVEEFIKEDVRFHILVSEAAENNILNQTLNTVRELMTDIQRAVSKIPGLRPRSLKYHYKIYESIRDKDSIKAATVMEEHLADVENTLGKYLELQKSKKHDKFNLKGK